MLDHSTLSRARLRRDPNTRGCTAAHALHGHLIGQPGSRQHLNTPALIIDLDVLEANIAQMAAFGRQHGLAIRPHAKTHKSADVARAQIAAGAVGQCCAKLGEAEVLAAEGISGLHLTSPVVGTAAVKRLAALNRNADGLSVVADHPDAVDALAASVDGDRPLIVLADIDSGLCRTGVTTPEHAIALVRRIAGHRSLIYGGVQFYCGVQQHIASFAKRRAALVERTDYLRSILARLAGEGLAAPLVTGGGTGSHIIDAELGLLTEIQPGSYIFMDRDYLSCDIDGSAKSPFGASLMVDCRVISANHHGWVTVDAGLKAFASDSGPPALYNGAMGSEYRFFGDEHGQVLIPADAAQPCLGACISLITPHCDPTANLYDAYHVVRGDMLVDIWPVTARGRSD